MIASRTSTLSFTTAILLLAWLVPCLPQRSEAGYEATLLRLHNQEREKRNLPKLRSRGSLNLAARTYARVMDLNNHFDHTGPAPLYSTFDQRILDAGGTFTTMGENIAYGQLTPSAVTIAWMTSPGHRRNILNRSYKFVGFGKAGSEPYWVTNFGG